MEEELAEIAAKVFKAAGSPVRVKILALCLRRERTSRELRKALGISKPLLIAHLRKLLDAGLLEYGTVFDEKRMIIRKYYRTAKQAFLFIRPEILERLSEEISSSKEYTRDLGKNTREQA